MLFGNAAALLSDGSRPDAAASRRSASAAAPRSPATRSRIGAEHLDMENRRRPRAVYVISDGGWCDTEAGVQKIRWLAELGVPTIHLSIGAEPLSVEAEPHLRAHRPRRRPRRHRRSTPSRPCSAARRPRAAA